MDDLGSVARHLLTLEVDTIVSEGISAERMPTDGQARIRIARLYKDFLDRVLDEMQDAGADRPPLPDFAGSGAQPTPFDAWEVHSGGYQTFGALRGAAAACLKARSAVPRPHAMRAEHDAILSRVAGSCGDIQAMLSRPPLKGAPIDEASVEWAESVGRAWPSLSGS